MSGIYNTQKNQRLPCGTGAHMYAWAWAGGKETWPGDEKRCSHNLQNDPARQRF